MQRRWRRRTPEIPFMASARHQVSVSVRDAVERTIRKYNRYRSPEATAELLELKGNRAVVKFSGPFCWTCGVTDYVEDFVYELADVSDFEVAISELEFREDEDAIVAEFEISDRRREPPLDIS